MASKREALEAPGMMRHKQPFPTATKVGNMVFTSAIGGADPTTGSIPDDPEKQIEFVFEQIRLIMEAAGGSPDNVGKVSVYLRDMQYRELVNKYWIKLFPDEHNRPVRHTVKYDPPGNYVIQVEFIAVL